MNKCAQPFLIKLLSALVCMALWGPAAAAQTTPTPGQNVNMVSGRQWPGGDPFLQRQNEPSIAVSTRNPRHLLAGANDYRTVDLSFTTDTVPGTLAGDAWLGVFKSFDGGQTWRSTLLPGCPQPACANSPLKGFTAAADPTVRPGTNGLFYYSGISFNRGTNLGVVFVARFMDLNNSESVDPIKYVDTTVIDSGTAGQFLDKTWLATDIPRGVAPPMCSIPVTPTQTIPAGNVYFVWSRFTGSGGTKIMFTRSLDCGKTWSNPIKVSESNSVNQGTVIAVDPVTGAVYLTWRRFKAGNALDAIMFASSTDFGKTFTKAIEIAKMAAGIPFDLAMTGTQFRTNALPTIAVSVEHLSAFTAVSRLHVAWAARGFASDPRDARIVMATSTNGGMTWSPPAAVDNNPITDDFDLITNGASPAHSFTRGHQFMPSLSFVAGKLLVLYYDSRLDHTRGIYTFNPQFGIVPGAKPFLENRGVYLTDAESAIFTGSVDDAGLPRRHTIDVRVAQSAPGNTLSFTSARISQFLAGTVGTNSQIRQIQFDPPDFQLFAGGTRPFLGDYIDLAGLMFTVDQNGQWQFNTKPSTGAAVQHAVWTSNRDVRPPADGNWTNYTPVGGGGPSIFDPSQTTPACVSGKEGMRNQNIYTSRITQGLAVSSPQNSKPLSPTIQRVFVIFVQNMTLLARTFRLEIGNQPSGGRASFQQLDPGPGPTIQLDVTVPALSGVARQVFATSTSSTANIPVNVFEITAPGGTPVLNGLSGFVLLNPDATAPPLDTPNFATNGEVYNPVVSSPATPDVKNPDVKNPDVKNPDVKNPDVKNPDVKNVDIADTTTTTDSNVTISNLNLTNADFQSSTVGVSDASYTVTNSGNTTSAYTVNIVSTSPLDSTLQVIVNKPYLIPASSNCKPVEEFQTVLQSTITGNTCTGVNGVCNPDVKNPDVKNPDVKNPDVKNATIFVPPGETVVVTLRGDAALTSIEEVTSTTAPAGVAQGTNTDGSTAFDAALLITTSSLTPAPVVGEDYHFPLVAIGGKEVAGAVPLIWEILSTELPGLTINAMTGELSATPTQSDTFSFKVKVTDSSVPPKENTRTLSLTVNKADTSTTVTNAANPSVFGQAVSFTATVSAAPPSTSPPPTLTGTVQFVVDGLDFGGPVALAGGMATSDSTSSLSVGSHTVSASYSGDSNFNTSTSPNFTQTVKKADTTTTIISDTPDPSSVGQSVVVTFSVTVNPPGGGTPPGNVTVSVDDGSGTTCSAPVSASGSCTILLNKLGSWTLTATYAGDSNYNGSSATEPHQVLPYNFNGFLSPLLTAAGSLSSPPVVPGTTNRGSVVPLKWILTDFSGNVISSLSSLTLLQAIPNTTFNCAGAPSGTPVVKLYEPTSGAAGGSTFRFSSPQFIFNWDTSTTINSAAGCYTVVMQLNDGSAQKAITIKFQ